MRVHADGAGSAWLLEVARVVLPRRLRERRGVLKDERRTTIVRLEHAGQAAVVKHYHNLGLRYFLKGILRLHPARRSRRASLAMAARGLPTPRLLGLVERTCLGLLREAWLIFEDLPGAVEMDRFILRRFAGNADPGRRRRFVLAFAAALRKLLLGGLRHRDLKTCNVLVRESPAGWSFDFIDLDDCAVLPPAARPERCDWVRALGQLNPSTPALVPRSDRLRFLNAIPELAVADRRRLVREVEAMSRARGRRYFSDEGPVELEYR